RADLAALPVPGRATSRRGGHRPAARPPAGGPAVVLPLVGAARRGAVDPRRPRQAARPRLAQAAGAADAARPEGAGARRELRVAVARPDRAGRRDPARPAALPRV